MRARTVIDSGYADVADGRLFFEVAGSGQPIVLIHGNAGDRRHWDDQFTELAKNYRVVRYDVRGYGRSSVPEPSLVYSDHGDLAALLDHLDIESAHVAGWSMGSGVAVDFAVAYPSRVLSLISVGPWANGYSSDAVEDLVSDMSAVGAAFAEGGAAAALDAWMRSPFFSSTTRDERACDRFSSIAADYSWWAFANASSKTFVAPAASSQLSEIATPSLILTAEHDIPACMEIAGLLDELIPNSRKIEIPGTGHLAHMERSAEFNRHLLDFLGSVGGS